MTRLAPGRVTRWAAGDGGLAAGEATMTQAAALEAMPSVGLYAVELDGVAYEVERVGSRYCSVADLRAYGIRAGDDFADETKYPDAEVMEAIQAAEEAIEEGCRRSFCERARDVLLPAGAALVELPEQDVRSLSAGTLVGDRQAVNSTGADATARMVYGARAGESIRRACCKLAASYLRARVGAENARGTSVDGVYVSYELATGEEGSWTGLPEVDAVIARNRSRRRLVG